MTASYLPEADLDDVDHRHREEDAAEEGTPERQGEHRASEELAQISVDGQIFAELVCVEMHLQGLGYEAGEEVACEGDNLVDKEASDYSVEDLAVGGDPQAEVVGKAQSHKDRNGEERVCTHQVIQGILIKIDRIIEAFLSPATLLPLKSCQ